MLCRYSFQMGTHNICLYKELDKKYTGCKLNTMELLDCALIGVSAVIRSNTVCFGGMKEKNVTYHKLWPHLDL